MTSARERFDTLVAEHGATVVGVCRAILRDEHLGQDAAQDALLRAWERLRDGVGAPTAPAAWLRRIALTSALDLRRRRSLRDDDARHVRAPSPVESSVESPAVHAEFAELRARLDRALETLSDRERTVFVLRHDGGLTLAEIADTLGVATPTAKTQFARACVRLQAALARFDPKRSDTDAR